MKSKDFTKGVTIEDDAKALEAIEIIVIDENVFEQAYAQTRYVFYIYLGVDQKDYCSYDYKNVES
jgi:hypothetical protein